MDYPSPQEMLGEHLRAAAARGFAGRVASLLASGVAVDTHGYHPIHGDATPYELAVRHGHLAAATLLADAGADTGRIDAVDAYVGELLAGKPIAPAAARPVAVPLARQRRPDAVRLAAAEHGLAAVERLLVAGFGVNEVGADGATALHQAAGDGAVELCQWLLAQGADASVRDGRFAGTPADWADHGGHRELAEVLRVAASGQPASPRAQA